AIMRITRIQIECGFNAPYGPMGRSGTSGRTTNVAPAKIKASLSSSSVITEDGGQDQCNFRRQAGIVFVPTPIGGRRQYDEARGHNRKQHLTADDEAD